MNSESKPPPGPGEAATPAEPGVLTLLRRYGLDPFRCLAGVARRWWLLVLLGLIGAGLAGGLAYWKSTTVYSVKLSLLKKEIPSVFRAGRLGEAYMPAVLRPATLIAAADSPEALRRVGERINPPMGIGELRGAFTLTEEKKTDLLTLEVSTTRGPGEAVELANIWGEELVRYTRDMQSSESREIRKYVQSQLEAMDAEIARVDSERILLIQRDGMVDADKEIEAYLRGLTGIELEFHNARIGLESLDAQIASLRQAIRNQNPGAERLRLQREEYEKLRATYTDNNPMVLEARAAIENLEREVEAKRSDPSISEDAFTGTGISDALFLELTQLENQKKSLTHKREELEKLIRESRGRLQAIPEKMVAYQKLADRKLSLQSARELVFGRLQEARLFEERAPGYLAVLAPATADDVITSGRKFKTVLAGALGGMFLAFLGFSGLLMLEAFSPKLRTHREIEMILGARQAHRFTLPGDGGELESLWATWMTPRLREPMPQVLWAPRAFAGESVFWTDWLDRAARLFPSVIFVDLADEPMSGVASGKPDWQPGTPPGPGLCRHRAALSRMAISEADALAAALRQAAGPTTLVLARVTGPIREPAITLSRNAGQLTLLAHAPSGNRHEWRREGAILAASFATPPSMIAVL